MMGLKARAFKTHTHVNLEQLIPRNDFYRQLETKLDLSFVRPLVADTYASFGRPSIDPVVFFKLQLLMFFEGIRSERLLLKQAHLQLAWRWYLGYDLDEALPDHSSLTKIRIRYGLDLFQRFFERIVALCTQAGLVWGQELHFDGTVSEANADYDKSVPRFYWDAQQHLGALFEVDGSTEGQTDAEVVTSVQAQTDAYFVGKYSGHERMVAESFGLPALALQHLRYVTVSASEAVPLAADETLLPVLVFSHGLVGLRIQNSSALQELASWGYVVVALDHTDASAVTVFPDGEARFFDMGRFDITYIDDAQYAREINDKVFPVWVDDQRFVYDTLAIWMTDDPLLRGRLDLTRIGSLGHSFGGATALEVCRIAMRCRAAVNLDGGLYGDIVTIPAVRPLMLMTSAESYENQEAVSAWRRMMAAATGPAYWLELPDSTHFSFTITQLLSPILVPPNFEPRDGLRVIDKYLRTFFDLYVRENASERLAPDADVSDVRWIID